MYNIMVLGVILFQKFESTNKNILSFIYIMKRPIKQCCQIIWNYYKYKVLFYNFNALNGILCYFSIEKLLIN